MRAIVRLAALGACLLAPAGLARGAEATFTTDVPPGQWKAARVRNVPKDGVVSVAVTTNGPVAIVFVNEADYKRLPSPERPLFRGKVETKFSFAVTVPAAGHYYLVIDNRAGKEARAIEVTFSAVQGGQPRPGSAAGQSNQSGPAPAAGQTRPASTDDSLREFESGLNQIFIFKPFPIRVETCGSPRAFSGPEGIVLCREYALKLYEKLGDKQKAADALMFTLFHELGHVLLKQWSSPVFEHEEVADEFATVVMIMLGQKERVRATPEFFTANPSLVEALLKTFVDDRHPLSVQRSRNILRWLDDSQLVKRWQPALVPRMQTALLERLRDRPTAWTDATLVGKELAARP
jgi:hypothetical protein